MRFGRILAAAWLAIAAFSVAAQEKGGEDLTGPYDVVQGWPKLPLPGHEGWVSGPTTAVLAESADRIIMVQRGELKLPDTLKPGPGVIFGMTGRTATSAVNEARREHYILVVDRAGNITDTWTQWDSLWDGSAGPHHLYMNPYDPEKHVWIVNDGLHQVFKFTNDGKKLVMTLGERLVPGDDEKHFARPAGMAFLPDGTFFVTDGYVNRRVVKFDKDGKFLMAWGRQGTGPGEFSGIVHTMAADASGRLYVADRGTKRVQVFDSNGKFLDEWPNVDPWYIHVAGDQSVWVADGGTNKILKYDRNGRLQYSWGTYGQFPGGLWGTHQFSVDQEGNLYTAEPFNGRVEKFVPRKGAKRSQLIAPPRR
mgnify:CR=1 FL=1